MPSHGADELLDYICRLFLSPGDAIVNCPPTFGMYSFDAKLSGAEVVEIWRNADYSLDVAAIEALFSDSASSPHRLAVSSSFKLLFLTSPNNPSGNWLPDDELRRLLALPVMVVLDEAYVEFADQPSRAVGVGTREPDRAAHLQQSRGIAGLRLGYGILPSWLLPYLWKFNSRTTSTWRQRWRASPACVTLTRCSVVKRLRDERQRLIAALADIAYLKPYPSHANFVLCDVVRATPGS
ncbi:MAG: aminotransferase class I/II-fold pyridoxal phosphate-dependent enzyme [Caldilineaceae bacterium]